jgi:hypothetical protein
MVLNALAYVASRELKKASPLNAKRGYTSSSITLLHDNFATAIP